MPNEESSRAFEALRAILAAHGDSLKVTEDTPDYFAADSLRLRYKGHPVMFDAVRLGKNYVSFHFMPAYVDAQLRQRISPELRRRMHGEACFNFKPVNGELLRQLAELTAAGLESLENGGFKWPGLEVEPVTGAAVSSKACAQ